MTSSSAWAYSTAKVCLHIPAQDYPEDAEPVNRVAHAIDFAKSVGFTLAIEEAVKVCTDQEAWHVKRAMVALSEGAHDRADDCLAAAAQHRITTQRIRALLPAQEVK